ncbi:MAG: hypothetical protein GY847_22495 [Proteobacteria bacterium]|nr:hypothetical protein [Pseudomonadota bacterium]
MPGLAQPKQLIETFEYKDNSIIFNYSAAYYESPEDITFSYILEGFNQEWSEWTKETKKEYINLELKHEIHMGSYYIDTHDRKRRETA